MSDHHQHPSNGAGQRGSGGFVPLADLQNARAQEDRFNAIRERLAGSRGREYWRGLDELAGTPEFQQYLEREFPVQAPRDMAPLDRRSFMKFMSATLALAGVGGCAYQPPEKIIPYVEQPESLVPGKPMFYASAFPRGGYGLGILGEQTMGRPIKIEGNPEHPASLGATDIFAQASILSLYDPDRSQGVRHLAAPSTWEAFQGELARDLDILRQGQGQGLRIVTGAFTSPTMAWQVRRLLQIYPQARLVIHDPTAPQDAAAGAQAPPGTPARPGTSTTPAAPGGPADASGTGAMVRPGTPPQGAAPPQAVYRFDRAQRILALDSDFLRDEPGSVRYAREFMANRNLPRGSKQMNRLYVVESTHTLTGANADHRLGLRPSQVEAVARAIAAEVGAGGGGQASLPEGVTQQWVSAVVEDLRSVPGGALVIAGPHASAAVRALAQAINGALGSQAVEYLQPIIPQFPGRTSTLRQLVDDIQGGRVRMLVVLDSNPVYTAPADLGFNAELLERVPRRIHLGLEDNETAALCHWHLPMSHYLEAWSDVRAFDGTTSIVQPLIRPLYTTRSIHELLAMMSFEGDRAGYDIVRQYWMTEGPVRVPPSPTTTAGTASVPGGLTRVQAPTPNPEFESWWHRVLLAGVVPNTRSQAAGAPPPGSVPPPAPTPAGEALEVVFRPDPTVWDGTFANNAWLQELPKPLSQLTWDNAAFVSPNTAVQLGFAVDRADYENMVKSNGQNLDLTFQGRTITAPLFVLPGQPDGVVTLTLGYGRGRVGNVGRGMGYNAYALRTTDALWQGTALEVTRGRGSVKLASAQHHFTMEGRELVKVGRVDEYAKDPAHPPFMKLGGHSGGPGAEGAHPAAPEPGHGAEQEANIAAQGGHGAEDAGGHPSIYGDEWPSDEFDPTPGDGKPGHWESRGRGPAYNHLEIPAWGMVIDLNACIGCGACTIACQAENNIATVGKEEVLNNREMHWIRVSHYYTGEPGANPGTVFQPVPCMHCEKAPCEPVCPVEATSHSAEGINEMTYNRCIGTRYCANNCPYKVRRFNYFQYADQDTPSIQLMANPDVTVRSRGVMEKCTYCVQRINHARIEAEKEERPLRDGDVVTACQQVCPTNAIVFGDVNDRRSNNGRGSRVRQLKELPTSYALLTELNTRPRTSYLARLRNPNPALEPAAPTGGAGETGGH